MSDEFAMFWEAYPNKKSKASARKAFVKAIKKVDLQTMLAAIDQYKRHKPDWQAFKHPATWLNGECWEDEWDEAPNSLESIARNIGWFDERPETPGDPGHAELFSPDGRRWN